MLELLERQQRLRGGVCDEAKYGRIRGRVCIIGGTGRAGGRGAKTGRCADHVHFDSPASMSMHEEATGAVNRWCPVMDIPTAIVEQVIRRASLPQQPRQRPSRQRVCTHWSALFVESRPGKAGKLVAKRDRHWATPIAAGESELSSSSICCAGASIFPLRGISASPKKLVSIT